jgi:hypothetical protein
MTTRTATTTVPALRLANLERVRQLKRTIAEAQFVERHERAMAQARGCAELAAVNADPSRVTVPEVASPEAAPASLPEPTQATDDSGTCSGCSRFAVRGAADPSRVYGVRR